MNSVDIIVSWPRNCDYPLWREFIRKNRTRFNEVIVAFTETNRGADYRPFIREAMFPDHVQFVDAPFPRPGQDWRNIAVNHALLHSYNSEWVWFTEQDFYPLDGFFENVEELEEKGCDVIAVYQDKRLHPCSIFMNRKTLQLLNKDFGIVPDKLDHFGMIQEQLEQMGVVIGSVKPQTYWHLNGLSQNWSLLEAKDEPNYQVQDFKYWLGYSLGADVPLHEGWKKLASTYFDHSPPPPPKGLQFERGVGGDL